VWWPSIDRITVMYGGRMAETGTAEDVFADPKHPYTQGLLASVPNIKLEQPELMTMPGAPPDLVTRLRDACFTPLPPRDGHLQARGSQPFSDQRPHDRLLALW
jgi:oligopeptide/dipeptide ABC transporter ATP-binding protein